MKKSLRAVFCASAMVLGTQAASAAVLFNYNLNGSFADSNGGAAIAPNGGSLESNGYTFAANQGLTIDLGGQALNEYAIETRFSFDTVGGYRKVVDFFNRGSDTGFYVLNSQIMFYNVVSPGGSSVTAGELATVRISRDSTGLVTGSVNGATQFTFQDNGNLAAFNGTNINLFMDDFATGQGEASGGYVDYVRVFDTADGVLPPGGVPEPSAWALLILGFGTVGGAMRARRRTIVSFA